MSSIKNKYCSQLSLRLIVKFNQTVLNPVLKYNAFLK